MKRHVSHGRNLEIAKIHIAKQQLGLDDETYREVLWTVARVRSSKDLTTDGRRKLLAHFIARGFEPKKAKRFPGRPHNVDSSPQLKKIEALLADGRLPWSYADAIAKRMFNVDRIAFCDGAQLQKIIAALAANQKKIRREPQP